MILMSRIVKCLWGRVAPSLLLGCVTAVTATAGPLLSAPSTFATLAPALPQTLPVPRTALFSTLSVSGVPAPLLSASWVSPTTSDVWDLSRSLRLASPWSALCLSDPSLRFGTWRQVLNVARLGKFVVPLRSDPAERTNIILAAQAVDGATVAPGAVFSFNRTVGERTPDRGYRDGLMFSEGQLIRGTGGGICIVATGLYNAALHAGMGLLERHPHSGIVGYAPPGCDASIVYGSEDMQFRNTTDTPVVVKTDIRDDCVVVSLYGQTPPPGRRVSVRTTRLSYIHAPVIEQTDAALPPAAPPVVAQKPRLGFDVTVERVITQDDRVLQRETVVDEHRAPRPEILRVPVPPVPTDLPLSAIMGTADRDAVHDLLWPFSPSAGDQAAGPKRGTSGP